MQEVKMIKENYFLVVSALILAVVSMAIFDEVSALIVVPAAVESLAASFFSPLLLQAAIKPAIARIANTFFIDLVFCF